MGPGTTENDNTKGALSKRSIGLWIMAAFYVISGTNHFLNTAFYLSIMPSYIPHPQSTVYFTGACEILLALMLLIPGARMPAAWLIIFLLVAIFPANIEMAVDWHRDNHPNLWLAYARLPLQPLLIWWAWLYTRQPRTESEESAYIAE